MHTSIPAAIPDMWLKVSIVWTCTWWSPFMSASDMSYIRVSMVSDIFSSLKRTFTGTISAFLTWWEVVYGGTNCFRSLRDEKCMRCNKVFHEVNGSFLPLCSIFLARNKMFTHQRLTVLLWTFVCPVNSVIWRILIFTASLTVRFNILLCTSEEQEVTF